MILSGPRQRSGEQHYTELPELCGEIWVANREDSPGHENLLRLCARYGFKPEIRFTSNDFDVIRGIVRENLGVALVPALALGVDRTITLRRLRSNGPRRKVLTVSRATDLNPLVFAAIEAIEEAAEEFVHWTTEAFRVRLESPLATTVKTAGSPAGAT